MTNSKEKGKRGERELAGVLREYGYDTRRGVQYKGGPDSPDVVGLPHIHIECKRVERLDLESAHTQAKKDARGSGDLPAVFHRRNNGPWRVSMELADFMKIYRIAELYWEEEK